tara:strand:+ start:1619 stop:2419 length:801 start_codon:yes stop_codon:yes gene_type:complete
MALKILQPGYVPLGQFDLKDSSTVLGGECVRLSQDSASASSGKFAKDVGQFMDTASTELPMFELGGPHTVGVDSAGVAAVGPTGSAAETYRSVLQARSATGLGYVTLFGLADDGTSGYGTLFGELIGGRAGQATSVSGATVIGPATHLASGKVTVWTQPGLYGVGGAPANYIDGGACVPNELLYGIDGAETTPGYLVSEANDTGATDALGGGGGVAIFVGLMADSSLVRTSTLLATGTATTDEEYAAVYLIGPSAPGTIFPAISGG